MHHNASAGDFISVVLIRTLPGALSSFAMTSSWCYGSSVKLDALENVAAFHILGLAKIGSTVLLE